MNYFLTGGTGFIGRFLVKKLLARGGTVHVLVREESGFKLDTLKERWDASDEQVKVVTGDIAKPNLGLSDTDLKALYGKIDHFFHLAAVYDMGADEDSQAVANIEGTRHAVEAAEAMGAKRFHHVSSIAAAGMFEGIFREDMFEEAEHLEHPYFMTKHESEKVVREECRVPHRIYRPGLVIGDSKTGEMNKIDGPYYFFKLIQKIRRAVPQWVPTIGIEGGYLNVVPVDFVVDAMDHIAHLEGEDGNCFHLVDSKPYKVGEILNIFAEAGHAPRMAMRVDSRVFGFIPPFIRESIKNLPPVKRLTNAVLDDMGIPDSVLGFINYPTRFDARETERVLKGTGIEVPRLPDYAPAIWDFWERNLDPDLFKDRTLRGAVEGRICVITGGTSGIGLATAEKLADAGAILVIGARKRERLAEVTRQLQARGAEVYSYRCDFSDMEDNDNFVKTVLENHGHVDYLINNAGRSIRRSLNLSFDRFHDFERTMQLNFFGSLRLIMGFAPSMLENGRGHVVNISSIGVLTNAPRFAAYVASKSALDAFSRCAAAEWSDQHVTFTTINMPLVKTPMIAPTKIYDQVPTLAPEEAADLVADAIVYKPKRIATRLGTFAQVLHAVAPKMGEIVMNTGYRMFPDTPTAGARRGGKRAKVSSEQMAFAAIMRGIHW